MKLVKKKVINAESFCRAVIVIGSPPLIILGILYLYIHGSPFYCILNRATGLYCTGCGSGRAAWDLVHGNIVQAMKHNLLMVVFLPFILYYCLKRYLKLALGQDILPFFHIGQRMQLAIIWVIIIFTIVRNIPFYPFFILAP